MKSYEDIGKNIKYYRQKEGLTQQALADRLGVTWEMVSRYETGKTSPLHRIFDIAQALNISPSELLQNSYIASPIHIKVTVPYFTSVPADLKFVPSNTHETYIAPLWITSQFSNSFAINSSLISVESIMLKPSSVIFIAPTEEINDRDLIVYTVNDKLFADNNINLDDNIKVVGKVIAIEQRFV